MFKGKPREDRPEFKGLLEESVEFLSTLPLPQPLREAECLAIAWGSGLRLPPQQQQQQQQDQQQHQNQSQQGVHGSLVMRAFRVQLSSAGSDMGEERAVIWTDVFPYLRKLCRRLGYEFEVYDLRAGFEDQLVGVHGLDRMIEAVHQVCSPPDPVLDHAGPGGPCFVSLVGQKYGEVLLPSVIERLHFERLRDVVAREGESTAHLEAWYALDENMNPPSYVMLPLFQRLANYYGKIGSIRAQARQQWAEAYEGIARAVRTAAELSMGLFDPTVIGVSALERELRLGVISSARALLGGTAFVFQRALEPGDALLREPTPIARQFVDAVSAEGRVLPDIKNRQRLLGLLQDRLPQALPDRSRFSYAVPWVANEQGLEPYQYEEHATYMRTIADDVCRTLARSLMDAAKAAQASRLVLPGPVEEALLHRSAAVALCAGHITRSDVDTDLRMYLDRSEEAGNPPLVLVGAAGCGKTSAIARLSLSVHSLLGKGGGNDDAAAWWDSGAAGGGTASTAGSEDGGGGSLGLCVISRFYGETPRSTGLRACLESLYAHVVYAYTGIEEQVPPQTPLSGVAALFRGSLLLATETKPLLLLLDGFCDLGSEDLQEIDVQDWIPSVLPANVRMIFTVRTASPLYQALREANNNNNNNSNNSSSGGSRGIFQEMWSPLATAYHEYVALWVGQSGRFVTGLQEDGIIKAVSNPGSSMAYVRLLCSLASGWASYFAPTEILNSHQRLCNELFSNLEREFGRAVAGASLGVLTASLHGLSDFNVVEALSGSDQLLMELFPRQLPAPYRFPLHVWLAIKARIKPLLRTKIVHGASVFTWADRQVRDAAHARYLRTREDYGPTIVVPNGELAPNEGPRCHELLVRHFAAKGVSVCLRYVEETIHHLTQLGDITALAAFASRLDVFMELWGSQPSRNLLFQTWETLKQHQHFPVASYLAALQRFEEFLAASASSSSTSSISTKQPPSTPGSPPATPAKGHADATPSKGAPPSSPSLASASTPSLSFRTARWHLIVTSLSRLFIDLGSLNKALDLLHMAWEQAPSIVFPSSHSKLLALCRMRFAQAVHADTSGDGATAERYYRSALQMVHQDPGISARDAELTAYNLERKVGSLTLIRGDMLGALELFKGILARCKTEAIATVGSQAAAAVYENQLQAAIREIAATAGSANAVAAAPAPGKGSAAPAPSGGLTASDRPAKPQQNLTAALAGARTSMYIDTLVEVTRVRALLKEYPIAHRSLQDCLAIVEKRGSGTVSVSVSSLFDLIADLHHRQGHFAEAEKSLTESYTQKRSVYGPAHPQTVASLSRLLQLLRQAKPVRRETLERARDMCTAALTATCAEFGQNSPKAAICYNNLGAVLSDLSLQDAGKDSKNEHAAIVCISRAVRLFAAGNMPLEQAAALHNLGMVNIEKLRRINYVRPVLSAGTGEHNQQQQQQQAAQQKAGKGKGAGNGAVPNNTPQPPPSPHPDTSGGAGERRPTTAGTALRALESPASSSDLNAQDPSGPEAVLRDTETCLLQALKLRQAHLPVWHGDIAETHFGLGLLFMRARRFADAKDHLVKATRIAAKQTDRSRFVLFQDQLCSLQMQSGEFSDLITASQHYSESIAMRKAAPPESELGRDLVGLAQTTFLLATCEHRLFRMEAAYASYRAVHQICRSAGDAARGTLSDAALGMALTASALLRPPEVIERHYVEALEARQAVIASGTVPLEARAALMVEVLEQWAEWEISNARYDDARALLERIMAELPPKTERLADRRRASSSLVQQARCAALDGRFADAERLASRALEALPADDPMRGSALLFLCNLALDRDNRSEADRVLRSATTLLRSKQGLLGKVHPTEFALLQHRLGDTLMRFRQLKQAVACYLDALSILENSMGASHPRLLPSLCNLITVFFISDGDKTFFPRSFDVRHHVKRAIDLCRLLRDGTCLDDTLVQSLGVSLFFAEVYAKQPGLRKSYFSQLLMRYLATEELKQRALRAPSEGSQRLM
jgi:tetratricopeptide (TPR) repeat protein